MSKADDIEDLAGYVPIKEAAKILGISVRRLYEHIEKGRLRVVRFAGVLGVPEEELKRFQRGITGRPRQNTPNWRIAASNDAYTWLHIFVDSRQEHADELMQKLGAIRKAGTHTFPGTAARYVTRSDQRPREVQVLLVWRGSLIPSEEARTAELEELRRELADLLDWSTARYETGQVLMHT